MDGCIMPLIGSCESAAISEIVNHFSLCKQTPNLYLYLLVYAEIFLYKYDKNVYSMIVSVCYPVTLTNNYLTGLLL